MEYLRWILLGIGIVVLVGIFLAYSRRQDDEELSLKGGAMVDPIDAHMEAVERKARAQRHEPILDENSGDGEWFEEQNDRQHRRKVIYAPELDKEPPADYDVDAPPLIAKRSQSISSSQRDGNDKKAVFDKAKSAFLSRLKTGRTTPETPTSVGDLPEVAASQANRVAPTSSVDDVEVSEASVVEPSEVEPTVVTLFLVSRYAAGFDGAAVRKALLDQGLEFGDMQIYHYPDPSGVTLFSVMNAMAPGTFDPNDVASHATRGLAMFIRLPAPGQPVLVLENMITVAHRLADVLSADILDDQKQPLDSESIDRMRELVVS
ncbi:MAG TPA: cell division protein ZipA [Halothiobacillus sp.]|nr:cell division protein ZipA [Halothiobacillus sp.]